MTTKLEKLKAGRERAIKTIKHRIAIIINFDEETSQRKLAVSERLLDRNWEEFTSIITALDGLITDDDTLNPMLTENCTLEDEYIDAKSTIAELKEDENNDTQNTSNNDSREEAEPTVKLERIKIKPFSGKYEDWQEFKDLFDSCITKNAKIPDIQKLQHLKGLLSEEPAMYVKNLKIKDNNFNVAWQTLTDHYENKYKVVSSYIQKFLDLPSIGSGSSAASDIKNMLLVTHDMLTSLPDLEVDTSSWDAIIVHLLVQKLDNVTMNYWHEDRKASKTVPKFSQFRTFLQTRQAICESKESKRRSLPAQMHTSTPKPTTQKITPKPNTSRSLLGKTSVTACEICKKDHRTFQCPKLINATVDKRLEIVREKQLCENCLFGHHETTNCTSQFKCRACNDRHHTLLHPLHVAMCTKVIEEEVDTDSDDEENEDTSDDTTPTTQSADPVELDQSQTAINTCTNSSNGKTRTKALLATALVPVLTKTGTTVLLRALLDQGSESSLITTRAQQLLNTELAPEHIPITAIGNTPAGIIEHSTMLTLGSIHDKTYKHTFKALVTKFITTVQPRLEQAPGNWTHLQGLLLADPKYFEPGHIDLLLGVQEYAEIMLSGVIKGQTSAPIAQLTKLGWVLSGNHSTGAATKVGCHMLNASEEDLALSEQLKLLWSVEEIPNKPIWSPEEQMAEQKFIEGIHRKFDGKLCVKLPFNMNSNDENFLGQSREMARSRFFQLEKKFAKNPKLYQEYSKCIQEYLDLGHMRLATPDELIDRKTYILPHHAVIKETSETTKVRVVFDASAKSSNGKSLNDRLCVGPTIQPDLFSLLIEWRKGKIAFIGDIEKMYRQIWVVEEDAKFQRILWRNTPTEPLRQYILLTVTFGTASAPFQAIRSLSYIADEIQSCKPEIAQAIKENFYVDDFIRSEETVEKAMVIQSGVTNTMNEYGMNIRKWKSNSEEFLKSINPNLHDNHAEHTFEITCKALGLFWCPNTDQFHFKLSLDGNNLATTKRKILSETAKLFDPLGWLAPCIIKAKILMQQLWLIPLGWDDKLPDHLSDEWVKIRAQLLQCDNIKIDRWMGFSTGAQKVCLHGFADASEAAYAATVYMRVQIDDHIQVTLVAAKTKVAPLKRIITVPNLELSAALLLAELMTKIKAALKIQSLPAVCWTDSTIVLDWLASPPHRWQTFVANRVSRIQGLVAPDTWKHVPTKLNPADCASRGTYLSELQTHPLWWHGPKYLSQSEENWPPLHRHDPNRKLPSTRKTVAINQVMLSDVNTMINRFSSLNKMLRITAYCLRWSLRRKQTFESIALSASEIQMALNRWILAVQKTYFHAEISKLQKKPYNPLPRSSAIRLLVPYIDQTDGFLKVSGRLHEANMSDERKHPIILPSKGHFTKLVVWNAHWRTFHGSVQLTLQTTRQRYWIVQGRNTIKSCLHSCVICFRYRKQPLRQLMGSLPAFRVQEHRPFTYTGVDFAGYFDIKTSSRRNAPFTKAYVAVFICLTTKAMHLEVVSSLSTEAFLMAFRRFLSRKLIPAHMYSDRGTNFIGASNELPRLFQQAMAEQTVEIRQYLATQQIEWHMIPAHAPHFGGLWEAGVKSIKYHLKRTLGEAKLNFEEFTTIIAQIEACLNSRPLYPLTEDPNDDMVITPSHLLFGFEAAALPEPCSLDIPANRLNRYKLIQRLRTEFWVKWSNEYLSRLQQRPKWLKRESNIQVDQVVLIKEDNLPPARWLYGRVTKVFPGKDGLIRAAEVQCKDSVLSRPIHKLCVLPIYDNIQTSNEST